MYPVTKLDFPSDFSSYKPKGNYVAEEDKWSYKKDNRGKYVHVHIPYNGIKNVFIEKNNLK